MANCMNPFKANPFKEDPEYYEERVLEMEREEEDDDIPVPDDDEGEDDVDDAAAPAPRGKPVKGGMEGNAAAPAASVVSAAPVRRKTYIVTLVAAAFLAVLILGALGYFLHDVFLGGDDVGRMQAQRLPAATGRTAPGRVPDAARIAPDEAYRGDGGHSPTARRDVGDAASLLEELDAPRRRPVPLRVLPGDPGDGSKGPAGTAGSLASPQADGHVDTQGDADALAQGAADTQVRSAFGLAGESVSPGSADGRTSVSLVASPTVPGGLAGEVKALRSLLDGMMATLESVKTAVDAMKGGGGTPVGDGDAARGMKALTEDLRKAVKERAELQEALAATERRLDEATAKAPKAEAASIAAPVKAVPVKVAPRPGETPATLKAVPVSKAETPKSQSAAGPIGEWRILGLSANRVVIGTGSGIATVGTNDSIGPVRILAIDLKAGTVKTSAGVLRYDD
jgi:hypothetical protein